MIYRMSAALLSLIGLFVSAYLYLYKMGRIGSLACGSGGCETVQLSQWSRFAGLEVALMPKKPGRPRRRVLDGRAEAHLIALACSEAPEGRERWSMRLLADRMVELGYADSLSYETVRRTLTATRTGPGRCRAPRRTSAGCRTAPSAAGHPA